MSGPFKMKNSALKTSAKSGSPMQKNYAGSPMLGVKVKPRETPLTPVEKARRSQKIMRSGTSEYDYNNKSNQLLDKHVATYAEHGRGAKSDATRKNAKKHGKIGSINRDY